MRHLLCVMLAKYAGQELTREVAAALVNELFPDRTPDVAAFGSAEYKGYTFQCELLRDIVAEIHPLHLAHYSETEVYRAGLPMIDNYEPLIERERAGGLLQVTARAADGALAGHIRAYLTVSTHTGTLIASEDALYLSPEHRGGFMAARLLQFFEKCAVQAGAQEIYLDAKVINRADTLARYLKYTHIANKFAKVFTQKPAPQEQST